MSIDSEVSTLKLIEIFTKNDLDSAVLFFKKMKEGQRKAMRPIVAKWLRTFNQKDSDSGLPDEVHDLDHYWTPWICCFATYSFAEIKDLLSSNFRKDLPKELHAKLSEIIENRNPTWMYHLCQLLKNESSLQFDLISRGLMRSQVMKPFPAKDVRWLFMDKAWERYDQLPKYFHESELEDFIVDEIMIDPLAIEKMVYYDNVPKAFKSEFSWLDYGVTLIADAKRKERLLKILLTLTPVKPGGLRWIGSLLVKAALSGSDLLPHRDTLLALGKINNAGMQKFITQALKTLHDENRLSREHWEVIFTDILPETGKANALILLNCHSKVSIFDHYPASYLQVFQHLEPEVQLKAWELAEKRQWLPQVKKDLSCGSIPLLCAELKAKLDTSPSQTIDAKIDSKLALLSQEIAALPAPITARFHLDQDLQTLQQGGSIEALEVCEFDLIPSLKLTYIRDLKELLALEKKVYKKSIYNLDFELVLEGLVWFHRSSPDLLQQQLRKHLHEDLQHFHECLYNYIYGQHNNSNVHILAVAIVKGAVMEKKSRCSSERDYFVAQRFLSLNQGLMQSARVFLATPTHSDGRIDARAVVDRYQNAEQRSTYEMILALHRLSRAHRDTALRQLLKKDFSDQTGQALAYALGYPEAVLGDDILLWTAAARARHPNQEDPLICQHFKVQQLSQPQAFEIKHSPETKTRSDLPPELLYHDLPVILLQFMARINDYDMSVWPANPEPYLRCEFNNLTQRISGSGSGAFKDHFYGNPGVKLSPMTLLILTAGLMYSNSDSREKAMGSLSKLIADGRIQASQIVAALDQLMALDTYGYRGRSDITPQQLVKTSQMAQTFFTTSDIKEDEVKDFCESYISLLNSKPDIALTPVIVSPIRLIRSLNAVAQGGEAQSHFVFRTLELSLLHFHRADSAALTQYLESLYMLSVQLKTRPDQTCLQLVAACNLSSKAKEWFIKLRNLPPSDQAEDLKQENLLILEAKISCLKRLLEEYRDPRS